MRSKRLISAISRFIVLSMCFSLVTSATYVVKPGDMLWKIGKNLGYTYQELAKANGIENPHRIYPGQVIKTPDEMAGTGPVTKTGSATMKGYGGDIAVTVSVSGNKLVDVRVVGAAESPTIGSVAVAKLPAQMLAQNKVRVDALTGATITSMVIFSAAEKALEQIGMSEGALAVVTKNPEKIDAVVHTDVIVVGGGGAGIAAAMAAKEAGKDVVLLEKLSILGGNTALSGGVITRAGIAGDPAGTYDKEKLYNYFMEMTAGKPNAAVVRTYVEKSADVFAWVHAMGAGVGPTARYLTNPEEIMALQPAKNSGRGLLAPMIDGVNASGVVVLTDVSANELILKDGKVVGVKATRRDGRTQEFYAKGGVVLATGGFPVNKELVAKYSSANADKASVISSVGTTGDGLIMGEKIGADVQFAPGWDSIGSNGELVMDYMVAFNYIKSMMINETGARFIAEDSQRPHVYKKMLDEIAEGRTAFFSVYDKNGIGAGADTLVSQGRALKADTLKELAEKMKVPTDAFLAQVERYNALVPTGDADFNKQSKYMLPITEGPFYASITWPIRTSTIGGLVTNEKAEVLDKSGKVIQGLFAGGEVANYSFFHNVYATCGSAVGHAVIFGHEAGKNAAALVK